MIRLIAAVDRKLGIGKHGGQPWSIPKDEEYFSRMTKTAGAHVLVGSSTYRTFKGPLPGRHNYVLTSHNDPVKGVELVHNLKDFLHDFTDKDIWVIGGAEIFKQTLATGWVDEIYLTHIDADFNCDKFFPKYGDTFTLEEQSEPQKQNGFLFKFACYVKREDLS